MSDPTPGASGPPPGPAGPPPGPSGGPPSSGISSKQLGIAAAVILLVVAIVAAVLVSGGGSDDSASAAEVELQPVSTAGTNPFMPSAGTDQTGVTPPPAATAPAGSGVATYSGDLPGLYGGTRNISTCDPEKIVIFLEQNPDKGRAWAGALGISTTDIRSYVSGLTSVILRTDTWVTNHGYENGVANEIPAVLQAGTAVLVDKYGYPVVKCYCGNPLTSPRVYKEPSYIGTRWPAFTPTSITIIQKTTIIIDTFTLVDTKTGQPFTRPAGGAGRTDGNAPNTTPTTTTPPSTTAPPAGPATTLPVVTVPTQPTPPPPPPPPPTEPQGPTLEQQEQAAGNRVAQAAQQCYPFPAPIEDSTGADTSYGDVTPTSFSITVTTHTTSGGTQTFVWTVDRASGGFTPVNDLAQVASGHCSLLN